MSLPEPLSMRRLAPLVLASMLFLPAARAEEAAVPAAPAAAAHETVLRLSETAEKPVRRDRLRAELRVEVTGANPRAVQDEVNRRMAAALERVRVVPTVKGETGAHGIWEERPQNAPPRWRAMQAVILTGRESVDLLQLVGELQGDGLLLGTLQHELTPEAARAVEDELTRTALQRLHERAEKVAQAMGLEVARWKEVRVGSAGGQVPRPPMPIQAMRADAKAGMAPPVAEAGEAPVRLTVEGEVVLQPGEPKRP
jgi:predicted secreted protein